MPQPEPGSPEATGPPTPPRGKGKIAALAVLSGLLACALTLASLPTTATAVAVPRHGTQRYDTKLFVRYETTGDCTVYPNYPRAGIRTHNRPWTVPSGRNVIWRYNVDEEWAVISDPARAGETFPWWGFTRRSCLGDSIEQAAYPSGVRAPNAVLQGRSTFVPSGWRPVRFDTPSSRVVTRGVTTTRNATLRDHVNFVVGNVRAGWQVDVSEKTRSRGHWIKVYAPRAKQWGYIERTALS